MGRILDAAMRTAWKRSADQCQLVCGSYVYGKYFTVMPADADRQMGRPVYMSGFIAFYLPLLFQTDPKDRCDLFLPCYTNFGRRSAGDFVVIALFALCLFGLLLVKKEIPQKLSVVFQKLGAVTYPIYLFQMPVIEWLVIIGILHA